MVATPPLPPAWFLDSHSPPRRWMFDINLGHVHQLQQLHSDFRLERILVESASEASRIAEDTGLLVDVLEVLLRSQLRDRGVTLEDFLTSLQSTSVTDAAYLALVSAVANFCHSRVAREQARRIFTAMDALWGLDQQLGTALEMSSGMPSGSSPPAPESSHGDIPCETWPITPEPPPNGAPPPSGLTPEPFPLAQPPAHSTR